MKKVFLTLAVVFMAMAANAQVWMGGSFGLSSTKENANANPVLNYSIAPEAGFSIAPRFDLAVGLKLAGNSYTNDDIHGIATKYAETAVAIQPYVRYKAISCGKVGFFVDGGFEFGYGVAKIKTTIGSHVETVSENTNYFMIALMPGVSFAASDNITFAARIGSLGYYQEKDGRSEFGLNVNNAAFTLGLWWAF